jgi:hypothetical protein
MTTTFCYAYGPDGEPTSDGSLRSPNTMTFRVATGDFEPSVVAEFQPQCMDSLSAIYMALNSTLSPGSQIDAFHAGQLLYSAAKNAFQPDQWPTSVVVWVPDVSELQIQVDGTKVATLDIDTGDITPV